MDRSSQQNLSLCHEKPSSSVSPQEISALEMQLGGPLA